MKFAHYLPGQDCAPTPGSASCCLLQVSVCPQGRGHVTGSGRPASPRPDLQPIPRLLHHLESQGAVNNENWGHVTGHMML